jgi:CDGSH-type Zn-finger protein
MVIHKLFVKDKIPCTCGPSVSKFSREKPLVDGAHWIARGDK